MSLRRGRTGSARCVAPPALGRDVRAEVARGAQQADLRRVARRLRVERGRVAAANATPSAPEAGHVALQTAATGDELGTTGPRTVDLHAVLGERAGLVGADDVGRPEGLDRAQALDERSPARETTDADRQRERDRRQQTLRHVRDEQADREDDRVRDRQPGERADRDERHCGDDRYEGDELRDAADLDLQRAVLVPGALRERSDAAQLGGHTGRGDDPAGVAAVQPRAAEDEIRARRAARRDRRRDPPPGGPARTPR